MIHRPFNYSLIEDNNFIKISANERLADEIYYYQYLQQFDIKNLFAEFIGDFSDGNKYVLCLKNYNYNNFYESLKLEKINKNDFFLKIIDNLQKLHSFNPKNIKFEIGSNQKILIDKTELEFKTFVKQPNTLLDNLTKSDKLIINNQECWHFNKIWPKIKKIIKKNYLFFDNSFIHGDFCLANIICDYKTGLIKFIDPRGSYYTRGCYGDKAYDYAKILHSLHGNYEQIIYNDYQFTISKNLNVEYKFLHEFTELYNTIELILDAETFKKSKLIEGLLFISMCSRHYNNEEHQFIMYCQGLLILNDFIKNQSKLANY